MKLVLSKPISSTRLAQAHGLSSLSGLNLHIVQAARSAIMGLLVMLSMALPGFAKNPSGQTNALAVQDFMALVDLYNATDGPNWTNNSGWLTGDSPCGWYGIVCQPNGRVIGLDLHNNNLTGSLPTTLPLLTKLKVFNVHKNKLVGTIPTNLSQLVNLQLLYLSNNQFVGTLPSEFSALTELLLLDVSANQLTGTIPASLSALTKAKQLAFSKNFFTGTIPPSFGMLADLQVLYLNDNLLTGSIPNELSMLAKLQLLSAGKNKLTGQIPASLGVLSEMLALYLNDNQLSGSIPSSLGNLTKLEVLYLNKNQLSGCIPASLSLFCGKLVNIKGNPGLPGGGDFDAFCSSGSGSCGSARQAFLAEGTGLQVAVQGNPVIGSEMVVEVRGAEGLPLVFQLRDTGGKLVGEQSIGSAGSVERQGLKVGHAPAGLLLLQVSSPTQSKTIKVIKNQ
ncbi:hypothetical protein [Spirosoma sp. KNUC1025]|uniref:hypothetical protein n=1 Tax=Spirosoma sp. KNUC1025 TaxID=2894082 RepID=UPI003867A00C|nr:hypothetical protein LN737_09220 [Spirosoma sp. KNUC1025]